MLERKPLAKVHNDCCPVRKVQRTYGRRGKTSMAVNTMKDIFATTTEVEKSLQGLTISDKDENGPPPEGHSREENDDVEYTPTKTINSNKPSSKPLAASTVALSDAAEQVGQSITRPASKQSKPRRGSTSSISTIRKTPPPCCTTPSTLDERLINELCSKYCDRKPLSFQSYGKRISRVCDVTKIGEGTYSSVFALTRKELAGSSQDSVTTDASQCATETYETTILKMMPILLPSMGDLEGQTEPFHIANELETMQLVDSVHGFIRYRGLTVVHGPWPTNFLDAFRKFKVAHRKKAENQDPEEAYGPNQFYALIEMEDAGRELSDVLGGPAGKRPSDFQIWDVVWQTCVHLAHAEGQCAFEHRDLHVSNVCIKPADPGLDGGRIDIRQSLIEQMVERPERILGLSNIAVTIIDYTFSRANLVQHDEATGKAVNFREFVIEGDEYDTLLKRFERDAKKIGNGGERFEDRMQQLTYAKVAKCVEMVNEEAEREGTIYDAQTRRHIAPWEHHVPRSNVCWLAYLVTCLLSRAGKTAKTKYIVGSSEAARSLQDEIRRNLLEIKEVLLEEDIDAMPRSADDVLRIGIEKGWLSRAEIDAFKAKLEEDS